MQTNCFFGLDVDRFDATDADLDPSWARLRWEPGSKSREVLEMLWMELMWWKSKDSSLKLLSRLRDL